MFSMLDGVFSSDRIIIDPRLNLARELIDELKNLQLEKINSLRRCALGRSVLIT
jgi:hypothetical protein